MKMQSNLQSPCFRTKLAEQIEMCFCGKGSVELVVYSFKPLLILALRVQWVVLLGD